MATYERKKTIFDIFTNENKGSIREVKIENPNRPLTSGEIKLLQSVYRNKVDCTKARIYLASYFPLNMQDTDTLITPNGNLYVMQELYSSDYSIDPDLSLRKVFVHEIGHIWQHQKKLNVLVNAGAIQACARLKKSSPNIYNIFETKRYPSKIMPNLVETLPKKLIDYNFEQQAEIFSDYWAIKIGIPGLLNDKNHENIKKHDINEVFKVYRDKVNEALA